MASDTVSEMSENAYTVSRSLDLRGIKCPMSFVRTKLLLDSLERDTILEVQLDAGESTQSVTSSVQAEGHAVLAIEPIGQSHTKLLIKKL